MSEYVVLEQEMKDMADTVTKYIPRITVCLEEIAKELGKHDEFGRSEGEKRVLRYLKDNKQERK